LSAASDPDAFLTALIRASTLAADPGRRVAETLADHAWAVEGASREALVLLGGSPGGDAPGRLAMVALGRHAEAMADGAGAVFGAVLDPRVVATAPSAGGAPPWCRLAPRAVEVGVRIERMLAELGSSDRLLLLRSSGALQAAALPAHGLAESELRGALDAVGTAAPAIARGVRERLDRLQGLGLPALAAPAWVLALDLPGAAHDRSEDAPGPLDPSRPVGRALEIELRRAGVWSALPRGARVALASNSPGEHVGGIDPLRVGPRDAALDAAVAAGRRMGLSVSVVAKGMAGEAEALARGMARVGRGMADGLAGTLPGCALAEVRLGGGEDRHERFARAGRAAAGDRPGLAVASWTPLAGGPDLVAAVALG
jgi:glycerate-2-kinase